MVLAGHGRLAAAKLLKMELVPTVTMAGLTDTEKSAFLPWRITRSRRTPAGIREMLALELGDLAELLPALNWDLSITGFPSVEIDCLMEDHGAAKPGSEDKVPALQQIAVTQPGDLWRLGKHHLLCGVTGGLNPRLNGASLLDRVLRLGRWDGYDRIFLGCRRVMRRRPSAVRVQPCSRPSRTLRAAQARWPTAILDRRCARRPKRSQVGTTGWPC